MSEGLQNVEGQPLDLAAAEQSFAQTMAAPPSGDLPAPPPDHGKTVPTERPKRGRPPKASRSEAKGAPKARPAQVGVKADYTEDAQKFVGSIWAVAASVPPTQAYALVLHNAADGLSSALAEGAKANETIRRFVSGGGQAGWQLQLAAVTATMGMQAMTLLKDPQLRQQCAETTRAQLKAAMKVAGLDDQSEAGSDDPSDVQPG